MISQMTHKLNYYKKISRFKNNKIDKINTQIKSIEDNSDYIKLLNANLEAEICKLEFNNKKSIKDIKYSIIKLFISLRYEFRLIPND